MANNIDNNNIQIQQITENFLRFRSTSENEAGSHLDEDSLSAFVEGNLTERENSMFLSHLSDCGFCLHKTAELAELQSHFEAADHQIAPAAAAQPAKISEVLSGLFSRLFGNFDTGETVFAHEEKSEEEKKDEDSKGSSSDDDKADL